MTAHRFVCLLLGAGVLAAGVGCATTRKTAAQHRIEQTEKTDLVAQEDVSDAPVEPVVDPLTPGYQLEAAENWSRAIAFYAAVLKKEPANSIALHRLAVIATHREDDEAAATYYRRALELDPRNASLLADAGYFHTLQKQYEPAALMLERAVVLEPENERAVNNLATVKGLLGEIDAALVLFRRVNPPADALQSLASIHEQRGEWQLALACYQEAHSVDPRVAVPEEIVAKVAALRQPPVREPEVAVTLTEDEPTSSASADVPSRSRPIRRTEPTPMKPAVPEETVLEDETDFFPADHVAVEEALPSTEALVRADWETESAAEGAANVEAVSATDDETASSRPREAALNGCCPVALRDQSQVVDGRPEFCRNYEGVIYAFASAEAVQKFQRNPERYIPSAGGLDVVSVRSGRMERGSLHYSTWFRNRLFLFTSADHVDEFRSDPLRYIELN